MLHLIAGCTRPPISVSLSRLDQNLIKQCHSLNIPIRESFPDGELDAHYSLLVDGIFGFSFSGAVRAPFDALIARVNARRRAALPLVSIDLPSGWDVERGPVSGAGGLHGADTLVSLTAPKLCARHFRANGGRAHFVGGRFVPPSLAAEMGFAVPEYEGTNQIVRLSDDYGDGNDAQAAAACPPAEAEVGSNAGAASADSCPPRSGL